MLACALEPVGCSAGRVDGAWEDGGTTAGASDRVQPSYGQAVGSDEVAATID